jgi:hypothetical protein
MHDFPRRILTNLKGRETVYTTVSVTKKTGFRVHQNIRVSVPCIIVLATDPTLCRNVSLLSFGNLMTGSSSTENVPSDFGIPLFFFLFFFFRFLALLEVITEITGRMIEQNI